MRILLIEDDERVVSFLTRGLEAEGYTVDVATDGETGHEMATSPYDLIILISSYRERRVLILHNASALTASRHRS